MSSSSTHENPLDIASPAPATSSADAVKHGAADEHLRAIQSSLSETQAIAHLGSWDFDVATQKADWSDETYRIIGVDPATFVPSYEGLIARIHPDDRAAFDENYIRSVADHGIHDIDIRVVTDEGTIKYVHTRGRTYYDAEGRPVRSIGTILDITERREAETALAQSEKRYRALVETISEMIWETDIGGTLTYVSPAVERIVGCRPEEVLGKPYTVLLSPYEAMHIVERARKIVEPDGSIRALETSVLRTDGVEVPVEASVTPVVEAGNVVGYRGVTRDISERKRTEATLKQSEVQLANALELSRAAPWEYDVATNLFTFNDIFYAIFGTTADEVGGYQMTPEAYAERFVYPADIPTVAGEVQIALETSDPDFSREIHHRFNYANGDIGMIAVNIRVVHDENRRTVKTYGVNQDITKRKRLEEELIVSRALAATAVECSLEGVLIVDTAMRVITYNRVFLEMWRIPRELAAGGDDAALLQFVASELDDPDGFIARVRHLYDTPAEIARHEKFELNDGRVFDRDCVPLYDENGKYLGRAWFFRDITESMLIEQAIRQSEENFRAIFATVREGIFVTEPDTGKFIEVNPSGCRMFGYSRDELIGADIGMISSGEPPYTLEDAVRDRHDTLTDEPTEFDWHCRTRDGRLFWAAVSLQHGMFRGRNLIFATLWDITERKKAEATILQMACYDPLSGLLNRRVFMEALDRAIAHTSRTNDYLAVLYLDLDHFKDVNDILGHRAGDLLLEEVSRRLRDTVREDDTVARFGGDEFAVLMSQIPDPEDAAVLAQKLVGVLAAPYTVHGNEVRCGTSIGIATYGEDSPDAESLITHADVALYRAKAEGRGTFQFFTEAMDHEVKARVSLANELRAAISNGQLELYYQPQVQFDTGNIVGLEALVRWNHPRKGLVGPSEFIEAAERAGLIIDLGRWVMQSACRQARAWLDMQLVPKLVSVNISALQFKSSAELEKDIAQTLIENRLAPQMLELELTETVLMDASRRHREVLERLRDRGIRIAIDDFGTGYSSLDYLRKFHVDRIKIAQNFVCDLENAPGERAIVRAAMGLARELGLGVIAEGIETKEQLLLLTSWGCREGQGYYFARPLPVAEMTDLLRRGCGVFAPGAGAVPTGAQPISRRTGSSRR
jgi:diguanylate cyclase (GGDEF)-like protein/PAS domain S-box-containing protein